MKIIEIIKFQVSIMKIIEILKFIWISWKSWKSNARQGKQPHAFRPRRDTERFLGMRMQSSSMSGSFIKEVSFSKSFAMLIHSLLLALVFCKSFSRWRRPVTFPRNSFMISCHLYLGFPRDRISLSSQLFTVLFHRWPLVDVIFSAQFHIFLRCKTVQHSIFWSCMSFTTLDVSASIQST